MFSVEYIYIIFIKNLFKFCNFVSRNGFYRFITISFLSLHSQLQHINRIIFVSWDFSQLPQPRIPSPASSRGCFSEFERISRGQEKRAKVRIRDRTAKFYVFIQLAVRYECISAKPSTWRYGCSASLLNSCRAKS